MISVIFPLTLGAFIDVFSELAFQIGVACISSSFFFRISSQPKHQLGAINLIIIFPSMNFAVLTRLQIGCFVSLKVGGLIMFPNFRYLIAQFRIGFTVCFETSFTDREKSENFLRLKNLKVL